MTRLLYLVLLLCAFLGVSAAQGGSGSGQGTGCKQEEFRCLDNSCIPDASMCNGVADCPLEEDELICDEQGLLDCRPDQISCASEKRCISLAKRCDGIFDCAEGNDETNCAPPTPGSPCTGTQFECSTSSDCIPIAGRCNSTADCVNGEDEEGCVPPQVTNPPPTEVFVQAMDTVTLECVTAGDPPPFVTWLKNFQPLPRDPRYSVTSEGGVGTLTIRDASFIDQGSYSCVVQTAMFGMMMVTPSASLTVNDTSPSMCEDHLGTPYLEGELYYNLQVFGAARDAAADVIFVVDESGSMAMEHQWIRSEVLLLDRQLRLRGVGVGDRENLYALVGFGRPERDHITGIVLSQLASPEDFISASQQLMLTGLQEDGYAAIIHALDNINTRPGTAKLIVLITDERRGIIRKDLSLQGVEERLEAEGFVLNVAINQHFLTNSSDPASFALGLGANGTAYVFDPSHPDLYTTQEGGVPEFDPITFSGGSFNDYAVLAYSLRGAAWDLNQLRHQGLFAEAFSNAFTEVKVMEVMEELGQCFVCVCAVLGAQCSPAEGVEIRDCFGPILDRCIVDDTNSLFLGETRVVVILSTVNFTRAADVILVVDESGSMTMEHQWIANMTQRLDDALIVVDIGVDPTNQFGVVGFGDDCVEEIATGRVVTNNAWEVFSSSDGIGEFTTMLSTSGRREDGYSGINVALDGYDFRDVARQFILITDEDRDVLNANFTREGVQEMLDDMGVVLNAAVSEEYRGGVFRALGIDSYSNAYVFDPSSSTLFRIVRGTGEAVPESGHGSTNMDYTQLALGLGGASWDLSLLRRGSTVAEAFTNAFVYAKVLEIRRQMEQCLNCTCSLSGQLTCTELPDPSVAECMPMPVPLPGETPFSLSLDVPETIRVLPGQQASIVCTANTTTAKVAWTFNGGLLPPSATEMASQGVSTLTIQDADEGTTGFYSCLAHSQNDVYNAAAMVYIEFYDPDQDLNISLSPLALRAARGQNISITCSVPEPAIFSWLFEDDSLPGNAITTVGMTYSVLTIVSAEDSNIGGYTCLVNNTDRDVLNDDTAYLDVRASYPGPPRASRHGFSIRSHDGKLGVGPGYEATTHEQQKSVLILSVEPQLVNAMEGDTAVLTCLVNCFCPGTTPMWARDDGFPLPYRAEVEVSSNDMIESGEGISATLTITGVSLEDSALYRCSAEFNGTTAQSLGAISVMNVIEFAVELSRMGQVGAEFEETLFIVCETTEAASMISWRFEGETVHYQPLNSTDLVTGETSVTNIVSVIVSTTRAVLTVLNATEQNEGVYECVAESEDGQTAQANVTLVVSGVPTSVPPLPTPSTMMTTPTSLSTSSIFSSPASMSVSPPASMPVSSPVSPPASMSVSPPASMPVSSPVSPPASMPVSSPVSSPASMPVSSPASMSVSPPAFMSVSPPASMSVSSPAFMSSVFPATPTPTPTPGPPPDFMISVTSPSGVQIVEGRDHIIVCSTTHPVSEFMWAYNFMAVPNNTEIVRNGPKQSTLTVLNATISNFGGYQCAATSELTGETRSTFIRITFRETLAIALTPPGPSVTVNESSEVVLQCTLDCGCSGTELIWQRPNRTPLPQNAVISYSGTRRTVFLTIQNVGAVSVGAYSCFACNSYLGNVTETIELVVIGSNGTILTPPSGGGEDPDPVFKLGNHTVAVIPSVVTLPPEAMFTFICKASAPATFGFQWALDFNEELPEGVVVNQLTVSISSLMIANMSERFRGVYSCRAMFADFTFKSAFGRLEFEEPLAITLSPRGPLMVAAGDTVQVECSFDCICAGDSDLKWMRECRDGRREDLSETSTAVATPGPKTLTLSFASIAAEDDGVYVCIASRPDSLPEEMRISIRITN